MKTFDDWFEETFIALPEELNYYAPCCRCGEPIELADIGLEPMTEDELEDCDYLYCGRSPRCCP